MALLPHKLYSFLLVTLSQDFHLFIHIQYLYCTSHFQSTMKLMNSPQRLLVSYFRILSDRNGVRIQSDMLIFLSEIITGIVNYCNWCVWRHWWKNKAFSLVPIRNVSKAVWCCWSSVSSRIFFSTICFFPLSSVNQTHPLFGFPCMSVPNCSINQGSALHADGHIDFSRLTGSFYCNGLDLV